MPRLGVQRVACEPREEFDPDQVMGDRSAKRARPVQTGLIKLDDPIYRHVG